MVWAGTDSERVGIYMYFKIYTNNSKLAVFYELSELIFKYESCWANTDKCIHKYICVRCVYKQQQRSMPRKINLLGKT